MENKEYKKLNILSFDCANRSLGVCLLSIDPSLDIKDLNKSNTDIKLLKVVDLTKGVKYTIPKKAKLLKQCLTDINKEIGIVPDIVLVEFQMKVNDKSRCVCYQIIYHYSDICKRIHIVSPSLKNRVFFNDDLRWTIFGEKYKTNYTANKNHSKSNFLHYLKINDQTTSVENIAKKNLDDIADAFMQILGFLKFKY